MSGRLAQPMRTLALALLIPALGCPGARSGGDRAPQRAVQGWTEAVRRDDPHGAYALLSAPLRRALPYEEFERRWKETQKERAQQAVDLGAGIREEAGLGERARVTLADGKTADLVHEPSGWKLEAPLMAPVRASTPQDALRLLAAAIEARSYEGVLRILTQRRREALSLLVEAFERGLKSRLGEPIEVTGDRVFFEWAEGRMRFRVILVRENGEWRVEDVKPAE
jgi:hypothetical protein